MLSDDKVKIYLEDYNGNSLVEPQLIEDLGNNMLFSKINQHSTTMTDQKDKYKLRIWFDEDIDVSEWDKDTPYTYQFKIEVDSYKQKKRQNILLHKQ